MRRGSLRNTRNIMAKSNEKGGDFERSICKCLSLWITNGKRQDIFWRTSMSGGRAKIHSRVDPNFKSQFGDITAVDKEGYLLTSLFVIECKRYRDFLLDQILSRRIGTFIPIWNTLCEEAKLASSNPMLIGKKDHCPEIVCFNSRGLRIIQKGGDFIPRVTCPKLDLHISCLSDLFTKVVLLISQVT